MSEIKDFYGRTVAYAQVIYGPKQPTVEELKEQIDQLRSELDRHQELLKELVVDPKSTSPEFLPHFEKARKNPVYWMEIATLLREELEAERGKVEGLKKELEKVIRENCELKLWRTE